MEGAKWFTHLPPDGASLQLGNLLNLAPAALCDEGSESVATLRKRTLHPAAGNGEDETYRIHQVTRSGTLNSLCSLSARV